MNENIRKILLIQDLSVHESYIEKSFGSSPGFHCSRIKVNELTEQLFREHTAGVAALLYETDSPVIPDCSVYHNRISACAYPVIVICHHEADELEEFYISNGADDFITTNHPPADFLKCLSKNITRKMYVTENPDSNKIASALFNQEIVGVGLFDSHTGKFLRVNSQYCKITGYSEQELLTKDFISITHPDDIWEDLSRMDELKLNKINSFTLQKRYIRKNGEIVWVNLTVSEAVRENDLLLRHIAIIQDITIARETALKLQYTERHYRALIEKAPDGIVLLDVNGKIIYVSPTARNLFSYHDVECSEISPSELTHPEDLEAVLSTLSHVMSQPGSSAELTYRFLSNKGEWLWVASTFSNLLNEPSVNAIVINFKEITAKKLAEEELNSAKNLLTEITSASPDIIYIFNLEENRNIYQNRALKPILGFAPDEGPDEGTIAFFDSFIHPDDRDQFDHFYKSVHDWNQDYIFYFEYRLKDKNGEWRWFRGNEKIFEKSDGRVIKLIGTAEEITQRKTETEKLRRNEEKLREAQQTAHLGYWDYYIKDERLEWSEEVFRIAGYQEPYSQPDADEYFATIHPEDKSAFFELLEKIKKTGEPFETELRHKKPDGEYNHTLVRAKAVCEGANVVRITGVVLDITGKKLTEKQLNDFQNFLTTSVTQSPIGIVIMNSDDFRLRFVNNAALRLSTLSDTQIKEFETGKSEIYWHVRTSQNEKVPFEDYIIHQAINTGRPITDEESILINHYGERIWIRTTSSPVYDKEGKIFAVVVLMQDISEQKKAQLLQEALLNINSVLLKENSLSKIGSVINEQLSKLLDTSNLYIAFLNKKKNLIQTEFCTDETISMTQWDSERSVTGFIINHNMSFCGDTAATKRFLADNELKLIGGLPVSWMGTPLHLKGKAIGAIVIKSYDTGVIYDESDLKTLQIIARQLNIFLEKQDAESELLKLSKAVIQSPASVIITDTEGNIEFVNPKFTEITGYTLSEVIGKNPRVVRSGLMSNEVYRDFWHRIKSGGEWRGEFLNKKKNGELFWEDVSVSPLLNDNGEVTHYVAVKEDITKMKEMIAELTRAKELAESMNRAKSSFFANMSHELRTPLIGILGYSEVLEELFAENEELLKMTKTINSSGQRLLETLNMILNISKIESEKIDLKLLQVNLIPIIEEAFNLFKPAASQKGIEYKLKLETAKVLCILDPAIIHNILNNIINNAIKFTSKGSVTVFVGSDGEKVFIRVTDTGIGISKEEMSFIWEDFRQASEGMSRNYEGTGLGLSIAKKYTELMGGSISAESVYGQGSTFEVSFAISKTELLAASKLDRRSKQKRERVHSGLRLLYVEDDNIASEFVELIVKPEYYFNVAVNGEEALLKIQENHYDILLVDINLRNGHDGLSLTKKIREIETYKKTPVVAVTAYAMSGDREEFLANGFDYYLPKPFSHVELLELLSCISSSLKEKN